MTNKNSIQPDQMVMAVLFWYLVKCDSIVNSYCTVAYTGEVTFYKVPEKHGPVYAKLKVSPFLSYLYDITVIPKNFVMK